MRIAVIVGGVLTCGLIGCARVSLADNGPTSRPAPNYQVTGPETKAGLETWVISSDYDPKPCPLYVLLPDQFDKAKRYKVLYILPCWEKSKDGIAEARKLGLANKYDIICVGPDFSVMPWYADHSQKPKMRYESYLPEVVVPFIEKTYPTIAEPRGRILVGYSKSGIGSVTLLLKHPEVFGRAGAWDAPLMEDHTRAEYYGPQDYFMKNYYIPDLLKRRAEMLQGQPARLALAGYGFGGMPQAHALMEQLKIPHYFDDTIRPEHDWRSGWLGPLVGVLMTEDMTKAGRIGPMSAASRPARPRRSSGSATSVTEHGK